MGEVGECSIAPYATELFEKSIESFTSIRARP